MAKKFPKLRRAKIVNCTPHPIHLLQHESYLYDVEPQVKLTIPKSSYVGRVEYETHLVEKVIVNNQVLDITSTKYRNVVGLPPETEGVILIVSKLVAEALHGKRNDLYILSGLKRAPGGKILGGRSLAKLNPIEC